MLWNLIGFFKSSPKSQRKYKQDVIPGTTLTYDAMLVRQLHEDHKELLGLYGDIKQYLDKKDYHQVQIHLKEFSSLLREHLLLENLKLYVYLSNALACDQENLEIMIEMRKEMGRIGKTVNQFLTRYTQEKPWTIAEKIAFSIAFQQIGTVLSQRITKEEERLYPLYMPPSHYF